MKSEFEEALDRLLEDKVKNKHTEVSREFFRTVLGVVSFDARQGYLCGQLPLEKFIELQNSIINIADYLKINNPLYLTED